MIGLGISPDHPLRKEPVMLFEEVCYLYVEAKSEGRKKVRPNTLEGYMSAIRCHLMPKWSGREIESITADELQAWVDSFERPGAARKAFNTFRQIHRWHLRTHRVRIYDETQGVDFSVDDANTVIGAIARLQDNYPAQIVRLWSGNYRVYSIAPSYTVELVLTFSKAI